MTSVIEVLFARRPEINYVSPPACEVIISSFSGLLITLSSIGHIPAASGLIIRGEWPGPFYLDWSTEHGDGPPVICYNIYQVSDGQLILVAECVNPPPGGGGVTLPGSGTFVVTPVTPEGEGPPSQPITTPGAPPPDENPPSDCTESGDDTTCSYGPTGDKYRINNFHTAWLDISSCGLSWTNCVNCEIFGSSPPPGINCKEAVEWSGTFPVKVNDGQFIDQEFEPDPSCGSCFPSSCPGCEIPPPHKLHGFCISAQLITSSAPNGTGCGWAIVISAPFVGNVWTGVKSKGEGPTGKYVRDSGCCPGPECVIVEAY